MILLAVIAFASICSAQQIKIVEKLADGSYVVAIDNVEFRAISGDKAIEIAKQKLDLETATKVNAEKDSQIAALNRMVQVQTENADLQKKIADSFKADFERSQEDAKRNYGLFIGERTLRQESAQFIPKGNAHGFWAKALDAVNSQQFQIAWKLGVPTYQMLRCR